MPPKLRSQTRTEEVYDALRADLLNGTFEPGQRLKLVALGHRFGTSLSVVREALTRLSEQNLVVATPQRGFSVRALSLEDLTDLTNVRVNIECRALEDSIRHGDMSWEMAVVASHHLLERTPVTDSDGRLNEEWAIAHREFHQCILSGGPSPRLQEITMSLRDSAELYRRWSWSFTGEHDHDLAGEHRRLKELALARDVEGAVATLSEHIERGPRALVAYAQEHGLET